MLRYFYEKIYPNGSKPARAYGLPKLHKNYVTVPPFRPIVSSIGTFNYHLASFLGDLAKDVMPCEFSCSDTFTFLRELKQQNLEGQFMISFDVCSLFTNIPLNETIDLAVDLILNKKPDLKISKRELRELFVFATSKTNFIFQGVIYDQIDGIAMGSPLAPILANLFMGYNESIWINQYTHKKADFYKRYVDDIFACFDNEADALKFFDHLSNVHPKIKFTKECHQNGTIPFLDVLISNVNGLKTSVYHKPTYTGLLTNFKSFVPHSYKTRLIHTLLDRTFKINSDSTGFQSDVKKLSNFLMRNLFPKRLIDKMFKRFSENKDKIDLSISLQNQKDIRYIKLPYIGEFSKIAKRKIRKLVGRFCNEKIQVNLVFDTCKIGSYFSTKDVVPKCFKSSVIYKFCCQECNSCYVGRTHKHFITRLNEHLETDKLSSINKHLKKNNICKIKNSQSSFSILDHAKTNYELALKEAMHIKWENPSLNEQKKHEIIRLLI